jgi:biotin carboxylase
VGDSREESPVPAGFRVPHLLLVGARTELIAKLIGFPAAVTAILPPGRPAAFERSIILRAQPCDLTDIPALLACAREVHQRRPVDAVLSLTEVGLYPASVVARVLGVRGNPVSAVAATRDKAVMRRRLADCGLETTAYRLCAGPGDAAGLLAQCGQGIILKPRDGMGSEGVALARTLADLPAAWHHATRATDGAVLAEEYLAGREYSVETLSAAGQHRILAITAKHTTGPPSFVETGHDQPADLTVAQSKVISATVLGALDAVGHAWGPCHSEIMVQDEHAAVVELNTRAGGDWIWEMVEITTGINFPAASAYTLAYGTLPSLPAGSQRSASVRFVIPPPGTVTSVTGLDQARSVDGVIRIGDTPEAGQVIRPLSGSDDRAGYVLAAGADLGSAARAAERALALLAVDTTAAETAVSGAGPAAEFFSGGDPNRVKG